MVVLAASVIIHKIPVSCTLGFTFQQTGLELRTVTTLTIFILYILSAPIGLLIGAAISENSLDTTLVIIQSLSAGTFVYLACCDLIVQEFHKTSTDN
jgi:zinc transporter ZupT